MEWDDDMMNTFHVPSSKQVFNIFTVSTIRSVWLALQCILPGVFSSNAGYHPLSDEFIDYINAAQNQWQAGRNFDPDTSLSQLGNTLTMPFITRGGESTMESLTKGREDLDLKAENNEFRSKKSKIRIPSNFDARTRWSKCLSLREIKDQGNCGSCWAISTSSAMSDRVCIASGGRHQPRLSAQNLMTCCEVCKGRCQGGCRGGDPLTGWRYFMMEGLVTGGDYNSNMGCQPYTLPGCDHYINGTLGPCKRPRAQTPTCRFDCQPQYNVSYVDDLYYGISAYNITQNNTDDNRQIQLAILKNGPVVAEFNIYEDFFSYKSGVYEHVSGQAVGLHDVRVLGWGKTSSSIPYWLAANSWNEGWGDNGTFKIKRGQNMCGFESYVSAGVPRRL